MIIWIDEQLSPDLAPWISSSFGIHATSVRDLGFKSAPDRAIFLAARDSNAIILTKDEDFLVLLRQLGSPPRVIWVTCGNTSNVRMRQVLERSLPAALEMLSSGEAWVEIRDALG